MSDDQETREDTDSDTRTIDLYDANEGKVKRTGGPYRDLMEREEAEKRRAVIEDREPDLDNPPATAATQLIPKDYLRENDTDKSHFSDKVEVTVEPMDSFEYTEPKSEADPNQVDFNNDMSVVNALDAKAKLDNARTSVSPPAVTEGEANPWETPSDGS